MPIYSYECDHCGLLQDERRAVEDRNVPARCEYCGRVAQRHFTPTANVFVHDHFRVLQSDFVPPKGDPAWEHLQTGSGSQVHTPRAQTFQEYFDQEFKGC